MKEKEKSGKLSGNTARLLEYLIKKFSEKEEFFISNKEIAEELNCSETGASLLIKRLCELKKLHRVNKSPRILSLIICQK
jgi:DNA-binding Lrp family transcriptional regulator